MEARELKEEDIEICRNLMEAGIVNCVKLGVDNPELEKRMMEVMREKMTGQWFDDGIESFPHYVFLIDGNIIGMGAYDGEELCRIYIDPSLQGKGIGTKVVEFVESRMREQGLKKSIAHSYHSSADFYLKIGYIKNKIYYYDYPEEGFAIPTIEMEKGL
jgi:GNAT superfamily N-acetyltransferase